jgi:hypothetical protein
LSRPFEVPYYPIPPVLGIVLNLLLGLFIGLRTWLLALGWLALGVGVYALVTRAASGAPADEPTAEEGGTTAATDPEDD